MNRKEEKIMSTLIDRNKIKREEIARKFEKELKELYRAWEVERAPLKMEEENQINKLLTYMKKHNKPLTAHQLYDLCEEIGIDMSIMQIAGNLCELQRWRDYGCRSRYDTINKTGNNYEIEAHHTIQKWCLLDENGEPTSVVKEQDTGVNAYTLVERDKRAEKQGRWY